MRIDVYLTKNGLATSRTEAKAMIESGVIYVSGKQINKPSFDLDETIDNKIEVLGYNKKYVSRGGYKLECAINNFNFDINDRLAIDIGASSGGFTDCLLQRGTASVVAIDAGYGQLHESLRADKRVTVIEHYNARELSLDVVGTKCKIVTEDVSFISQTYIIPRIAEIIEDGGSFISLIKPQFECGPQGIGKNGIVINAAYRYLAVKRVIACATENGFDCQGLIQSPITGGDGNKEYLACFVKSNVITPKIDDKYIKKITSL